MSAGRTFPPAPAGTRPGAWIVVVFLGFDALGGMVRWAVAGTGLEPAVYLPTALGLSLGVYRCLVRGLRSGELAVALWLLFQALVGAIFVANLRQVLFGLWLLAPVLIGYAFAADLEAAGPWTWRILGALYLVLVAGVVANLAMPFPWEGLAYSFGGQDIVGAKQWRFAGLQRLAGTHRSSVGAATLMLTLCILLRERTARRWLRLALLVSAGTGIVLTTSKGVVLSWILVAGWAGLAERVRPVAGLVAGVGSLIVCLLLPVAGLLVLPLLQVGHPVAWLLLYSTDDRISNIWPEAVRLVQNGGHWALGRGIGGLSSAQLYFERWAWNPADNVGLYLWGNFGLVGIALFVWLCLRLVGRPGRLGPGAGWVVPALLFFNSYGMVTNNLESHSLALLLGLLAAKACALPAAAAAP